MSYPEPRCRRKTIAVMTTAKTYMVKALITMISACMSARARTADTLLPKSAPRTPEDQTHALTASGAVRTRAVLAYTADVDCNNLVLITHE